MADLLTTAGWKRQGPFWSPPGSTAKYTQRAALSALAASTTAGPRPDPTWKKRAITDWLDQAGATYDPAATKAELLDAAAGLR